jgi:hypothetical protein
MILLSKFPIGRVGEESEVKMAVVTHIRVVARNPPDRDMVVARQPEDAKLLRMRNTEPNEEHLVGIREDSGIGSDGEGERRDCDGRKTGAAAEHANGVAEVGAKLVYEKKAKETEAEGGADVFFVGFYGAELDAGAAERFGWGETSALEIFGAKLDVGAEFGFDVGLDGAAMEEGVEIGAKLGLHDWNSSTSLRGWC